MAETPPRRQRGPVKALTGVSVKHSREEACQDRKEGTQGVGKVMPSLAGIIAMDGIDPLADYVSGLNERVATTVKPPRMILKTPDGR